MHAVEHAPALRDIEAVEQEGLEIAPRLRLAGRQRPLDGALQRIGGASAVGGAVAQEIGGIPHDGKADALDKPLLPGSIGERRQFRALPQFPLHLGDRKAVVLQEAGADVGRAGLERLVARAVV